jgi:7-cyano-7-deazaguanine synthase in queuosine biosynthesis
MTDGPDRDIVHLLWTGGWDSTFRLLQLLVETEARVQPIYVVDEKRASTPREIDTMRTLRREIVETLPGAEARLLPTRYGGSFGAITIEPHHRRQWRALQEDARVGYQHPNLASYAEQNDIERLEIGVQIEARASEVRDQLEPHFETQETPGGPVTVLAEGVDGPAALFERFAFPLLSLPKQDMKAEAERWGLRSIMEKTWFCYDPVLGFPCGACHPCTTVLNEGMGHRVGYVGPVLSTIRQGIIRARVRVGAWRRRLGLTFE